MEIFAKLGHEGPLPYGAILNSFGAVFNNLIRETRD